MVLCLGLFLKKLSPPSLPLLPAHRYVGRDRYFKFNLIPNQWIFNDVGETEKRTAKFCKSIFGAKGACPTSGGELTGLESQATVISGTATCQRVVIGGRAFFIGDTC